MAWNGVCLGSNVAVEPIENTQITESGLDFSNVIDKTQKWARGVVLSVGESVPLNTEGIPCVAIGDTVIYDRNKGTDYIEDAINYKQLFYNDLFKVFK
jgi:co-chaperonin GroES (HSP10)